VVRVPRNLVFNAIRVSCPDQSCQITRAVTQLRISGVGRNVNSIFSRATIPAGQSKIIKIKLPSVAAWQTLRRGAKSGVASVSVTVQSANGIKTTVSFRIGLKR